MNQKTHTTFVPQRPSAVARRKREQRRENLKRVGRVLVAIAIGVVAWAIVYLMLVASGAEY